MRRAHYSGRSPVGHVNWRGPLVLGAITVAIFAVLVWWFAGMVGSDPGLTDWLPGQ